jgi:hypothetical protein
MHIRTIITFSTIILFGSMPALAAPLSPKGATSSHTALTQKATTNHPESSPDRATPRAVKLARAPRPESSAARQDRRAVTTERASIQQDKKALRRDWFDLKLMSLQVQRDRAKGATSALNRDQASLATLRDELERDQKALHSDEAALYRDLGQLRRDRQQVSVDNAKSPS